METFDFHITSYDTEKLLQQVSEALEKRTELRSRERYPALWENIDISHEKQPDTLSIVQSQDIKGAVFPF